MKTMKTITINAIENNLSVSDFVQELNLLDEVTVTNQNCLYQNFAYDLYGRFAFDVIDLAPSNAMHNIDFLSTLVKNLTPGVDLKVLNLKDLIEYKTNSDYMQDVLNPENHAIFFGDFDRAESMDFTISKIEDLQTFLSQSRDDVFRQYIDFARDVHNAVNIEENKGRIKEFSSLDEIIGINPWVELESGVYLYSKGGLIDEQKSWQDNDFSKNEDFSVADFWLTTDSGGAPIAINTLDDLREACQSFFIKDKSNESRDLE